MKNLFKTTITIWTEYNTDHVDIVRLADDTVHGESYCSSKTSVHVADPSSDPDWDGNTFFSSDDEDEDAEPLEPYEQR